MTKRFSSGYHMPDNWLSEEEVYAARVLTMIDIIEKDFKMQDCGKMALTKKEETLTDRLLNAAAAYRVEVVYNKWVESLDPEIQKYYFDCLYNVEELPLVTGN